MTSPAIVTEEPEPPEPPVDPPEAPPAAAEPKGRLMAGASAALFLGVLAFVDEWATIDFARAGVAVDMSLWQLAIVASSILGAAGAFTLAFTRETRLAPPIVILSAAPGLFLGLLPFFSGYVAPAGDVRIFPDYGAILLVLAGVLAMWSGMRSMRRFQRKQGA